MSKKWIYVITRMDLTPSQIAVQSIHSSFEVGRTLLPEDSHPSVVLIKAKNEDELIKISEYLTHIGINYKKFIEPYYDDSLTSICTTPVSYEQRVLLKKFKLLRDTDFLKENNDEK